MIDPYNRTKPPPAAAGSETAYLQDPANAPFKPATKPAVTQQPNPTRSATGIAEAPLQPPAAPMVSVGPEIAVAPAGTLASEYGPPAGLFDFSPPQSLFGTTKKSSAMTQDEATDFALNNRPVADTGPVTDIGPASKAPRRKRSSSLLQFPELLR